MTTFRCALAAMALVMLGASAEAGPLHAGKGTILAMDAREGRLLMSDSVEGRHVLILDRTTRVVDETGAPIPASALQAGDLVREECQPRAQAPAVAREIRRLRPAWADLSSPEM